MHEELATQLKMARDMLSEIDIRSHRALCLSVDEVLKTHFLIADFFTP